MKETNTQFSKLQNKDELNKLLSLHKADPYTLPPQTPLFINPLFKAYPIRFLGHDGGIRIGYILYIVDNTHALVLDKKRMEIYIMTNTDFQVLNKRID